MFTHFRWALAVKFFVACLISLLFLGSAIASVQMSGKLDSSPSISPIYLPYILKSKPAGEALLVARFSPVLKFDGSNRGFPMSAETYFKNMMEIPGQDPYIVPPNIMWMAERYPIAWGYGPFSDQLGWNNPMYYSTMQTADIDGDGQRELLARASCGMETWRYNYTVEAWYKIASCSPAWSDAGAWGQEKYYRTIQTADIDGDGRAELLGRAWCGMETWRFNTISGAWDIATSCSPVWSDPGGWGEEKYYSTIQTADVNADGRAELLARSACGMETWRFNSSNNTWDSVLSCSPAWSDGAGWGVKQNYATIQTGDVDGDDQAELLGRSACGMETWNFNTSSSSWESVVSCSPALADPVWAVPQYYGTIQTADINGDNKAELLARSSCGMGTWRFNASSSTWEIVANCSPALFDPAWAYPQYYSTIQTADVDGDNRAELLGRSSCGIGTWRFNASNNTWDMIPGCSPALSDNIGWGNVQYYSTLQTADFNGDGRVELMGRGGYGMERFQFSGSGTWQDMSPLNRVYLEGRDDSEWGLSNQNYQTLLDGKAPTYFRVIYKSDGRARITYWWFYGYQPYCNDWKEANDGAHHGDWEHIMITTSPDRTHIDAVTYYFHGSAYTRWAGNYEEVSGHPVVYVGKLGHGSYHGQHCSGWMVGTPSHCCEFADYRESNLTPAWFTDLNLVDLDENSESWMLADRVGSKYTYNGQTYTIVSWQWGPLHAYCNVWLLLGCADWEHNTGVSTHPTVDKLDWTLPACKSEGCGTSSCNGLVYDCNTNHDMGWPFTGLSSDLALPVETESACGGQ